MAKRPPDQPDRADAFHACATCAKRNTCTNLCRKVRKHLAHHFRAINSPQHELWADIERMEIVVIDRGIRIVGKW